MRVGHEQRRIDRVDPLGTVVAIINPVSGAGLDRFAAERRVALVRDLLRREGIDPQIHLTERGGHAHDLARAAVDASAGLVLVWGGDGTVNEAASALVNTPTAFGLVPAGSGNGLSAALDVPRVPEQAIARVLKGVTRRIDVGMLGERAFFNIAGIGFDARIANLFNRRRKGRGGKLPYLLIGVREGCRYRGLEYDVELDGDPRHLNVLLMSFANGREYGMGARIAPGARLDDGLLEAVVVEDRPILARFWHTRHLAGGTIARAPRVMVRQIRSAVVRSNGPLEYHVDGEPGIAQERLDVRILPGALIVRG
jgi:diacylglycerol kinase (ATP)